MVPAALPWPVSSPGRSRGVRRPALPKPALTAKHAKNGNLVSRLAQGTGHLIDDDVVCFGVFGLKVRQNGDLHSSPTQTSVSRYKRGYSKQDAVLERLGVPSGKGVAMQYFALFYDVVDDFIARRSTYREDHLHLAREAHRRGELLLAGALTEPADRALLIFRTDQRSTVEDFAHNDPYVIHGLVTRWEVRSWAVVIGNEPANNTASGREP